MIQAKAKSLLLMARYQSYLMLHIDSCLNLAHATSSDRESNNSTTSVLTTGTSRRDIPMVRSRILILQSLSYRKYNFRILSALRFLNFDGYGHRTRYSQGHGLDDLQNLNVYSWKISERNFF